MAAARAGTWCGWHGASPNAAMRHGRWGPCRGGARMMRPAARSMRPSHWRGVWAVMLNCCMDRASTMPCSTMPHTMACRPWCWAAPASDRWH
ncbi:hypothetical protein G6F24_014619 [Rhizopus arrhizus]|nr:hypothetical protein G6F24_014619 [Rhizopus arrhizus]